MWVCFRCWRRRRWQRWRRRMRPSYQSLDGDPHPLALPAPAPTTLVDCGVVEVSNLVVRSDSTAQRQNDSCYLPPPLSQKNVPNCLKKCSRHASPNRFSPNPSALCLIVILATLATGLSNQVPPTKIQCSLLKKSRCAFPRPSKPTPRCTLVYCHIFEASDWAEQSKSSARLQFNDALNPPPPAIIPKKCTQQNAADSQFPA